MKTNVGTIDKVIRIAAALIIGILVFAKLVTGTTALVLGVVAIILFLTSLVSICPLYSLFGISTCKRK